MSNDDKNTYPGPTSRSKDVTSEEGSSIVDNLMFARLLRPFENTISAHFSSREAVVYRSVSIPAKEDDLKPRKLRKYESVTEAEAEYEMPEAAELDDKERLIEVNHIGSSVYTNEKGLQVMWQKGYSQKNTPREKRKYKEDMGEAIVRLKINEYDGLLQNEDEIKRDGHYNFLPATSFKIEDHLDLEYGYNGYMPFLEEGINKLKKERNEEK